MAQKLQIVIQSGAQLPVKDNNSWFSSGASDPYVTVHGADREPLCRTATIDNKSDPVWNETFDIMYDGTSELKFSVWDADWNSSEFVGTLSMSAAEVRKGWTGSKALHTGDSNEKNGGPTLTFKVIPSKPVKPVGCFCGFC
eukprot:TRINITY_DN56703_c0_g1_i1.p2 TRINITY_DN56703_c0_g1~~TRINITY_DN56703_c0_g1_i1.p2  ORF type:complete len:141 (+),score=19.78 TRINITY_DN56703_c0_g1_i1:207-629(+)